MTAGVHVERRTGFLLRRDRAAHHAPFLIRPGRLAADLADDPRSHGRAPRAHRDLADDFFRKVLLGTLRVRRVMIFVDIMP